jgi:hypothetical protein
MRKSKENSSKKTKLAELRSFPRFYEISSLNLFIFIDRKTFVPSSSTPQSSARFFPVDQQTKAIFVNILCIQIP